MYLIKDTVAKILANLEEIYNDKKVSTQYKIKIFC